MPSGKPAKRRLSSADVIAADRPVVEAAKAKAGGNARLAALFGVKESATSRWGQTRPIPRNLRRVVTAYATSDGERPELATNATLEDALDKLSREMRGHHQTTADTAAAMAKHAEAMTQHAAAIGKILNALEDVRRSLDRGRADRLRRGLGPLPDARAGG